MASVTGSIRKPEWEPASKGDMQSLFDQGRQYIRNGDGSEELYDLGQDPRREENLAEREPATLERLRRALDRLLPRKPQATEPRRRGP